MTKLSWGARASAFARTLIIQGSWNARTMIGGGIAFALLPVLLEVYRGRPEQLEAALRRHSGLFNAHPYLAGLAVGAIARMEADQEPPEVIDRFKVAVRGPLGGIGDRLVWARMLPVAGLLAIALWWAGAPAWVALVAFLGSYNVGHLALRLWAFRAGLASGKEVGVTLRAADLGGFSDGLGRFGSVLVGTLIGVLAVRGAQIGPAAFPLILGAGAAFLIGWRLGSRAWHPALWTTLLVLGGLLASGGFR